MVFCSECGTRGEPGARFCSNCGTSLASSESVGASVSAGFCGGCGQHISGTYLEALGGKWHEKCFVCTDCSKPFNGTYAELEGRPYCGDCGTKRVREKSGGVRRGFTVGSRVMLLTHSLKAFHRSSYWQEEVHMKSCGVGCIIVDKNESVLPLILERET